MSSSVFVVKQVKTIAIFETEDKAKDFLQRTKVKFVARCVNEDGFSVENAEKEFESRVFIDNKEVSNVN